jgi:pSer/pThr/pTyr-binding forkhead associated (FHA) protein
METEKKNFKNTEWFLEGFLENGKKMIIPIDKFPFYIGRKSDSNFALPSNEISRKHAVIIKLMNAIMIKDLGSTNGTYLNDKLVKDAVSLIDQDKIRFGSIEFKITKKEELKSDEFTLSHKENLKNNKKDLLDELGLTEREKEVLYLILEGKSTKIIAKQMNITDGTAKNYVLSILKKTDVHSRVELVAKFSKII